MVFFNNLNIFDIKEHQCNVLFKIIMLSLANLIGEQNLELHNAVQFEMPR